jgi:tripartite-type tricarboxylate transporter receptor subunit TctC
MKLSHHQFLHLAAGAAALPAVSRVARAQTYPMRPVRVLVAAAAGGATDITARLTGVGAPKNTPVEIIDKLNKEINAALIDPVIKARFADLGATMFPPGSPAEFGKFIADETEK